MDYIPRHDMKILIGDLKANVGSGITSLDSRMLLAKKLWERFAQSMLQLQLES